MALDGGIYSVGTAALTGKRATFTRPSTDTPADDSVAGVTYTDADFDLRIWKLTGTVKLEGDPPVVGDKIRQMIPTASATPDLVLSVGSGLTVETNSDSTQVVSMTITDEQLEALLGSAVKVACFYQWFMTRVGSVTESGSLADTGWSGVFVLGASGYGVEALAKTA